MVDFAGPMQARLAALRAAIVFDEQEEDDEAQSKRVLRYFWPGPVVVVFSEGRVGIRRRMEMAWQCLFRRNVNGLSYKPPEWARERERQI
jgi:hypothetical protein